MNNKKKILIVDDESINLLYIRELLEEEGYDVFTEDSGEHTLAFLEKNIPDLILMDINMPKMDGFEVCKQIKQKEKLVDIPLIFLTSSERSEDKIKGFSLGAVDFISKHFEKEELLARIDIHLALREKEIQMQKANQDLVLAKEIIKKNVKKYKLLFNNMINGFAFCKIVLDKNNIPVDYIFIEINDAFEKQMGLKRDDIVGRKATEVILGFENDKTKWIDIFGKVALVGEPIKFESFSKHFNKWFSIVAFSTQENYFATIFEDITERKISEKAIYDKAEFQKKTIEKSEKQRIANLVILNDFNKSTKDLKTEIKERKRSELIQKVLYNISNAIGTSNNTEELIKLIQTELGKIIDTKNFYIALYDAATDSLSLPFFIDEKDNRTHIPAGKTLTKYVVDTKKSLLANIDLKKQLVKEGKIEQKGSLSKVWLGVPLKIDKNVIGVIALQSYTDEFAYNTSDVELLEFVSDQISYSLNKKKIEDELNNYRENLEVLVKERTMELSYANAELAKASRMKDEFLANMSHELRTPLNAILGLSEALQEEIYGELNEKQIQKLSNIEESGRHLLNLINDILDLAKVEAGKVGLEYDPINIQNFTESCLLFVKQTAFKKKIKVSTNISSTIEIFSADQKRMKQIMVNLLSNAVKFTPEGGEIGLDVEVNEEKNTINFIVWDTGIGILPKDFEKLFQPFVQIDSKLSRQYAGTGLGLALVKTLVELHNGSIIFDSNPNKGSRFNIIIPIRKLNIKGDKYQENVEIKVDKSKIKKLKKVLIIEDSSIAADQIRRYLQELSVKILIYSQGSGAIEKAIKEKPDLIILDILLPDIAGWDVLTQLKNNKKTKNIPIVICSVVDEKTKGLELGANGYLLKPLSREDLIKTVSKIFNLNMIESDVILVNDKESEKDKRLILLAEDNEQNIVTIKDYLEAKQFNVMVVRNGKEAVEMANELKPELILMDIQMPVMDGLEAIKVIRSSNNTEVSGISIIALTALAMTGDKEKCLSAGANNYMSKPVGLKELVKNINECLANKD